MNRLISLGILAVFVFCLATACNADTSVVSGAWKSERLGVNGKPRILFITSEAVSDNKNKPIAVTFEKVDGQIRIYNAQTQRIMCYVSELDGHSGKFEFSVGGGTFYKITQEEADSILGK